jgi:phage gp29-like protein
MNLFGVEIGFTRNAAEPNPVATSKLKKGLEIGDSGTRILDGVINEEYNPKLTDIKGIAVYDEMRKSDGTVIAAVKAVTLPIRSAEWFIKPASEDVEDEKIAQFVEAQVFENENFSFEDFLRQALLSLPFGVMPFEKVFGTAEVEGGTKIVWSKLAPRMPRSIQKWAIKDGKPGITQNRSDGAPVEIPMEKLIVFVHEKEGENWWGTSILRPSYKHWFIKNTFYKIDAIAFERQGLGVPKGKLPENYTESDRSKMETILKNMRANSQAYVIEPEGFEVAFMDMMARTVRDPQSSIAHHNREIMKSVLAQFLELGSTDAGGTGGSRALSEDHSDLFLQSIEAIARSIATTFNKQAIKQLVDLNFDNVKKYPTLDFEGITTTDVKAVAEAYQILTSTHAVTPQEADEEYFRKLLAMPEYDETAARERPQSPLQPGQDPEKMSEPRRPLKKNFAEGFKPFRKLTFAEKKVNFDSLNDKMDELEGQFDAQTKALLQEARKTYMGTFTKAAHAGDTKAIKEATLKVQSEYERIIKNALKAAFEFGKNNAAKEIGANAPANPAEVLRRIDIQSAAIADAQIAEIVTDSKNAYVEAQAKGSSVTAALAAADAAADAAITRLTRDASSILTAGYINHGRDTVFDRNTDDIHGLQRSELLDARTCNYCESIDGRIIEKDDSFGRNTIFHSGCRGIWVAILKYEEELPRIDGIPQTLRDRFGDAVNDLIQPKKATTKRHRT